MEKTVNIKAADERDRILYNLDYELADIWGPNLPIINGGDHNLGYLNGTTNNQHESYDLDAENLRETLANPYLDEAAAAFRNNTRLNAAASTSLAYSDLGWRETTREAADHADFDAATAFRNNASRLNAATSSLLYSDIGWREPLKEADTDFGAAAATQNTLARLYNLYAGFRGLQIRERVTVNREGRIFQLMNDVDMHPVFNRLIESADVSDLKRLVGMIVSLPESLIKASLNPHGIKSVRKLIKVLGKTGLVSDMNAALCTGNGFYRLMIHPTGYSVIFKCLDVGSSEDNKLIYEVAITYCLELAKHERGCVNLKKFTTCCRGQGRQQLLYFIAKHSLYLSQDPTGNYVLQHVLAFDDPTLTNKICSVLRGHYMQISFQKGGSHVVERCFETSNGMKYVMKEFLRCDNMPELLQLARDRYGNYVIQTALTATKREGSPYHGSLLRLLKQYWNELQSGYGSNVLKLIARGVPVD